MLDLYRYWIRVFGGVHGGFYRATNRTDTPDGWRCYGKPLVIEGLTKGKAEKLAREYRRAGYVVRVEQSPC